MSNYLQDKKKKRKLNKNQWITQLRHGPDFTRQGVKNEVKDISSRRGKEHKDIPKEKKYLDDLYQKTYKSTPDAMEKQKEKPGVNWSNIYDVAKKMGLDDLQNELVASIRRPPMASIIEDTDVQSRSIADRLANDDDYDDFQTDLYSDIGRYNDDSKHDFDTDDNMAYKKLQNKGLNIETSRSKIPRSHQGRLLPVNRNSYAEYEYKNTRKADLSTIYGGDQNLLEMNQFLNREGLDNYHNFIYGNNNEMKAPERQTMKDDRPKMPSRPAPLNPISEARKYYKEIEPLLPDY